VTLATILLAIAAVLFWAWFDYERRNRADVMRQRQEFDLACKRLEVALGEAFEPALRRLNTAILSATVSARKFADAFRAGPRP
jgi:hypothetical protein